MSRLLDRVALITGAASGIGAAASRLFIREGARVAVADIDDAAGMTLVDELTASGGKAMFVAMDVTDEQAVAQAVLAVEGALGPVDVLYNNAGGTLPTDGRIADTPISVLWDSLGRDLAGVWNCSRAVLHGMAVRGRGAIVNASSMTALIGRDGADGYTAAKGAIAAITRSMAVEYGPSGIRVNAVAPGATLTPRVERRLAGGHFPQSLLDRHLLGLLEPEDVASVALFLASDEAAGVTGQVIAVDGGVTIS